MYYAYFEHHIDSENMHRFYKILLNQDVFGIWCLIKEWGRKGSPGTLRTFPFESECEAIDCFYENYQKRLKRGYEVVEALVMPIGKE